MRQLQQVLANQLSVRHPVGTLFSSDGYTLPPISPTSRGPCTSSGQSRGLLPQPAQTTGQARQRNCPYQHLLLFPLLLGQTALGEGTADTGEVKHYRLPLFSVAEPICL